MSIRTLNPDDVAAYRQLRLEALRDCPEAFATDLSEEESLPIEEFAKRLQNNAPGVTLGAFEGGQLVGIGTLLKGTRLRQRFRATIVGMYVAPAWRKCGLARKLLAACIQHARTLPAVEEVTLCITVGNEPARRVYLAFGFQPEYIEPRCFQYAGRYYDLEWFRLPLRYRLDRFSRTSKDQTVCR
jgi:GNAT superfamily N-acetyltransferase